MPTEKVTIARINSPEKEPLAHPLHAVFPRDGKIGTAVAWWSAGVYTYNTGKKVREWQKSQQIRRKKFTVNISSWDELELYSIVFKWVVTHMPPDNKLSNYDLVTGYFGRKYQVLKASNSQGIINLEMAGAQVLVMLGQEETKENNITVMRRDLTIRCRSQEDTEAVTEFISKLYHDEQGYGEVPAEQKRPYRIWTGNHWLSKKFITRAQESVVLAGTDKEDLFEDIQRFLDLKSEYLEKHIPWHRGYMFYGEPGTGKTSLALAVASTFELPVYFLSLSNITSDKELMGAISSMEHDEAVLIMEDVDVTSATHDREADETKEKSKVSLAALLNMLDGVDTPSGLISIMTTNFANRLDAALVRPGRMDHKVYVGFLDDDQLKRMLVWYLGKKIDDLPKIESDISPADITGIIKANMGFPEMCIEEVKNFIREANAT